MAEILREIGMIARALDSISNIEFKELELTKGQYLYLVRICENPGIIQEQLLDLIKVDRSTATRALQKLESNGFIEKRNDPGNRKIKKIYPTDKARKAYPFIIRENEHSNAVALDGFTEQEAAEAERYLRRIRQNIEADFESVKKGQKRDY